MARNFPQDLIEEIKARVSIRDVVADYVRLSKSGANWKALCPFHKEKTPSFMVHEAKGFFHCFGCGESGNIFTFLMKMENLNFPEAVERLARRAGVELPKEDRGQKSVEQDENFLLYRVNELAQKFYQSELFGSAGKKALEYLKQRGLSLQDIERFGLGYAPPGWDNLIQHLEGRGLSRQLALEAGLVVPRDDGNGVYDRFRDRVIFPIRDLVGRVRGFGARVLDDSIPKYINSPETPIYKKGEMLYGLELAKDSIRKKERVIIVEGYFDRISLDLFGFKEAVASLGTAFTEAQARIVGRYTRNVFLVFDADEAGRKASFRALPVFLSAGILPYLVLMPDGFDPDDLVRKQGAFAFEGLIENAPRLLDYYLESQLAETGSDLVKKGEKVRELSGTIALIPMGVERELYLKKLAELSGVSMSRILRTILRDRVLASPAEKPEEPGKISFNWLGSEELILSCLVNHPTKELAHLILDQKIPDQLPDSTLSQYLRVVSEEILQKGKAEPADYFQILNNSKWESIAGRALIEKSPFQEEQIFRVLNDAIAELNKRREEEMEQELTRRLNTAKKEGNDQLVMELLAEKNRLIQRRRKATLPHAG